MIFSGDTLRHDSEQHGFDLRNVTNESSNDFVRSVVGVRKARRFIPRKLCRPNGQTFSPAYHSRWVIARSASPRRYTGKFRALARATSGSLTTRIPKAFEQGGTIGSFLHGGTQVNAPGGAALLRSQGRVGARAVSDNRTYRRLETERQSLTNSGETGARRLSENPRFISEGKSCSAPNLGETGL